MTFGQRIKEARVLKKMTQRQLAELISAKHNSISDWENDKNRPDPDTIELLCGALDITPNYLLASKNKDSISLNEKELLRKYNALDKYGQRAVDLIIDMEYERATENSHQGSCDNLVFMTYYNKLAAAGNGEYLFDDVPTSTIEVPKDLARDADFVIGVNGDSMQPTFSDGDKVLVKKSSEINIGDIGIFIDGNDCYIKEKGKDCLVSHNREYGIIPGTDTMRCVGRVLGKI